VRINMGDKYILVIDQGTSATKAILIDSTGKLIHRCNMAHGQFYPRLGWVEHDAEEIYTNTLRVIHDVLHESDVAQNSIAAIAISNQRETAVVWDRDTGKPIYNAIVWQCQRGADICRMLEEQGLGQLIQRKTGLILSPYFSASKISWVLEHVEGARSKAEAGELLCGNIDAWLIWKLTGGRIHATDYSNASRTQLFNIHEQKWDEELLKTFNIPACMLPEVKSSNEIFGYTRKSHGFTREIPISGVMGDSNGALFGQNCFEKGMAKATYGTGSSIMMNIGTKPVLSNSGIVTSIAWGIYDTISYVFEGNINYTGDTIRWLVEDIELISSSREASKLASSVRENGGVYLVPAFTGLSAPYWNSSARATIMGMTRGTKKAHIVRAAEESIAYQIKDIIELMKDESGSNLNRLLVDGGPTRDDFLLQFQADILGIPVVRNRIEELSAMGAAYMAGLGVGIWNSIEKIKELRDSDRIFYSRMECEERAILYKGWKDAVNMTLSGGV
jgi:glycerol kinase